MIVAHAFRWGMTWNDIRNPDKIPAVFDSVEKPMREHELRDLGSGVLSRPEVATEFYPET